MSAPPESGRLAPFPGADLERAARLLLVRSRREATGGLVGGYESAFRGGGVEFEESRPYVPGDDVRLIDWNALARTGTPYVKRFREERDQTVLIALDVSRSMAFGTRPGPKARAASHVAALVTAAAARAGDRVGLVTFDRAVRDEVPPGRGPAHSWRILRALVAAAGASAGGTDLAAPFARLRARARRRAVVLWISDFRDDAFFERGLRGRRRRARPGRGGGPGGGDDAGDLVALARSHDVVAVVVDDPREHAIPAVGALRLEDPERPGRVFLLSSRRRRARGRYHAAGEVRRRALTHRLRADGVDVLHLRSDRDPLHALARFFRERPAMRGHAR